MSYSHKYHGNEHFRQFAVSLERAIARYGHMDEKDVTNIQKSQIERLVALETEFRRELISHSWGPGVYKSFVKHICEERRNILAARPFFRERQTVFTAEISPVLKQRAEKGLYKFHFNYEFILFVIRCRKWRKGSKILKLAHDISSLREEIVEMNLPLAISRARIFWSRTPKAQLSYMDLVQIAGLGLLNAVDKFVLPYSPSFRAMCIGRMVGNLIEQYSETMIHFFPGDKRKLYRANKLVGKMGEDLEALAAAVNEGGTNNAITPQPTNSAELASLLAASSTLSMEQSYPLHDGSYTSLLDFYPSDEGFRPDVAMEKMEVLDVLTKSVKMLTVLEQKLLKMKGVSL